MYDSWNRQFGGPPASVKAKDRPRVGRFRTGPVQPALAVVVPCLFVTLPAACVEPVCDQGWLAVQAQVMRLSPSGAKAVRLTPKRQRDEVQAGDLLCSGDTLIVAKGVRAELFLAGHTVTVGEDARSYVVEGRVATWPARAAEYLRLAFMTVSSLPPPEKRPAVSGSRGTDAGISSKVEPILYVDSGARQRLAHDLPVVVAWRNGDAPYTCRTLDDNAGVLWQSPPTAAQSCQLGTRVGNAARVEVSDARHRHSGWNLASVSWSTVPRPQWIPASAGLGTPAGELSAWAIWLWQNGGAEWRLQAIGMLNAAAPHEWLAAYFLEQTLAELPPLAPK